MSIKIFLIPKKGRIGFVGLKKYIVIYVLQIFLLFLGKILIVNNFGGGYVKGFSFF